MSDFAKIEGKEIVVRIKISALKQCVEYATTQAFGEAVKLTNKHKFAKEFVRQLNDEAEDGETILHRAFDEAIVQAIEQGAEGVRHIP